MDMKYKVLMVCLGNICRSPLAAGTLCYLAEMKSVGEFLEIDSAGTSANHVGEEPDPRSQEAAKQHGFMLHHQARQIDDEDFLYFDEILVMDENNLKEVMALAKTPTAKAKVKMLSEYDPRKEKFKNIPDPYYGSAEAFEAVYEQLWYCCMGFLAKGLKAEG